MIATYIQELLATNNRVIIPNYGAFLVRATSKSKDANTLEEKLKDVYFSPFLKFNDELLEKYIVKKENVTKEQAAEKINAFIEEIKKELDQEKPYVIKNFGTFTADKQGKVQFTPAVAESKETKKEEPKKEEPKTATKKATTKKVEEKPIAEEKKEEPKIEEKPVTTLKQTQVKKETKLQEFTAEERKVEQPVTKTPVENKPIYSQKKEKKSINKGLVWAIALGLPLAAVFIWALLNFTTVKKVFNKDKAKAKTEKIAKTKKPEKQSTSAKVEQDNTKQTQPTEQKTAKAEEVKQPEKPVPPVKKYYIIAGSFKNEKYADAYLTKL
ncbi:MAG TPA: HU family DNA-binding protein, partial [Bacteroidales bacterium]|nr:HU family DNA-binding protein [Bacteroidales bacterium]